MLKAAEVPVDAAIRAYWDDQDDGAVASVGESLPAPAAEESDAPMPHSADTPPSADAAHGSAPPSSPEPYAMRIEWRDLG